MPYSYSTIDREPCGYGLSSGLVSVVDDCDNRENWYALLICILTDKTVEQSLSDMGVSLKGKAKSNDKRYKAGEAEYQKKSTLCYILSRFCGLNNVQVNQAIGKSRSSTFARESIKFALTGERRIRRRECN